MSDTYEGPVRVLAPDGAILTTGVAALEKENGVWRGLLQTLRGNAVAGKALVVQIEIPDGASAAAQLTPQGEVGERATSSVAGFGDAPF